MNRKSWVRLLEAFIAITMLTVFLLLIFSRGIPARDRSKEIYQLERLILEEIANNPNYRADVLNNQIDDIRSFTKDRLPSYFNFTIKVCDLDKVCSMDFWEQEVYSEEIVISSTLQEYNPKKLKLFVWVED